jgi:hypothetical protein
VSLVAPALTFAALLAALRLAMVARSAYRSLSRAHDDLLRFVDHTGAPTTVFGREFDVHDALHRELASVLAQIEAACCMTGSADAADDSAAAYHANAYLSAAHEKTLHILGDLRSASRARREQAGPMTVVTTALTSATSL